MNERTHFFIKNIFLTLYSRKGWCFLRVRGGLRPGQTVILTQTSSRDHSSISFSSWLGLLNRGSLRTQSHLSAADFQFGILSPTESNCNSPKPSVSWLYFCLTSIFFRCYCVYLHMCISWLTARSKVNMLQEVGVIFSVAVSHHNRVVNFFQLLLISIVV